MKTRIAAGPAVGLLLLATAACSSTPGTPAPAASAAPSSSSPSVPKVNAPLDAAKYEQNPCALLSSAQATEVIKSVRNRQGKGLVGPICTWNDADSNSVAVGLVPGQGGLASSYAYRDSAAGYFQVAPDVNGYPAVYTSPSDDRKNGGCQAVVGIKDDETLTSSVLLDKTSPDYRDPCSLAAKAAAAAVATIKAGA
nr:DUF3558 domain-containing protein [Amycolatopsis benzoatilytica]